MPWRSGGCLPGRVSLFCAMWHVPAVTCAATRLLVICAMPVTTMSARATRLYCFVSPWRSVWLAPSVSECSLIASWVVASKGLGFFLPNAFPNWCFQVAWMLISGVLDCSLLVAVDKARPSNGDCIVVGRERPPRGGRKDSCTAGPTSDLSGGLLLRIQRVVPPHSAKGRPLPSCLEVAAHQNQKGGRRTTAPHFHRIELWWCQFLFLHIFICSHDFSFWVCS